MKRAYIILAFTICITPNSYTTNLFFGLTDAIIQDNYSQFQKLISQPNSLESSAIRNLTGTCAGHNKLSMIKLLFKYDIDPNECYPSPLYNASFRGHPEMVEIILENGENPNRNDTCNKETSLHAAARIGNTKIAKLLLKHDADTSLTDKNNFKPVDIAMLNKNYNVLHTIDHFNITRHLQKK